MNGNNESDMIEKNEIEERICCSDTFCTGIINENGVCGTCGKIGWPIFFRQIQAVDIFANALQQGSSFPEDLATACNYAVTYLPAEKAIPFIKLALQSSSEILRQAGLMAIGKTGRSELFESLPLKAAIRAEALKILGEHYPEVARLIAQKSLRTASPEVRLIAGQILGAQGFETLVKVFKMSTSKVGIRIEALNFLLKNFPIDPIRPVIQYALESRNQSIQRAGILAVRYTGQIDLFRLFLTLKIDYLNDSLGEATALMCEKFPGQEAEALLMTMIQQGSSKLKENGINSLRVIGSVAVIEPLMKLLENRTIDKSLRPLVNNAIVEIQSRLGDVQSGRLSIVEQEGQAGAVSIAKEGGELSVAEKHSAGDE